MSFFASAAQTVASRVHDGAIKTWAKWDPETVGEAQILEWEKEAQRVATIAAKAKDEADSNKKEVDRLTSESNRYLGAAEKLASTNETAALQAANKAEELKGELVTTTQAYNEAKSWADETLDAAKQSQQKVLEGRKTIEAAKRNQAQALRQKEIADTRLAQQNEMAGIKKGLSGTTAAIDALNQNAHDARVQADASKIRSGVMGAASVNDKAIQDALKAAEGPVVEETLAEKIARLKAA